MEPLAQGNAESTTEAGDIEGSPQPSSDETAGTAEIRVAEARPDGSGGVASGAVAGDTRSRGDRPETAAVEHGYGSRRDGPQTDWSGRDLRKAKLERKNLSGFNLSGGNLEKAKLRNADLRGANLCEANLRHADMYKTDLREADLTARGKSPDSSDYRSFRNLTWRWIIDVSEKPKTSNRAGSTPRSASRADSSRSIGRPIPAA